MDEQSGFNLLQAAVLEGEYNIVLEASGLLVNFLEEMEYTKTGNNAKGFSGKTAVDILSLVKGTKSNHYSIERLHKKLAENNSRLTELQWGTCNDDAEQAVELVLNDGVDINASGSDNDCSRRVVHPQVSLLRPLLILGPTLMPKEKMIKLHL